MNHLLNLLSNISSFLKTKFSPQLEDIEQYEKDHLVLSPSESISFFSAAQRKIFRIRNAASDYLWCPTMHRPCVCGGSRCNFVKESSANYGFFHAIKNEIENIPLCCAEPHLKSGYVFPHQPWRYYIRVLWIPSNELINVWTHLLPSLYFLSLLFTFIQTPELRQAWPLHFASFGCFAVTLLSALAHIFHSRSSYHHCCWFMVDFFGITIYAVSTITAHYFASAKLSYYNRIGWLNLPLFAFIGSFGFYLCCLSQRHKKASSEHNHKHKRLKIWSNLVGYLYGMLPIAHRIAITDGDDEALYFYKWQFFFTIASGLMYSSSIPERFCTRKFDIIGHSHQIFHVLGVFMCYYEIMAIKCDVISGRWNQLSSKDDYPSFQVAVFFVTMMVLSCLVIANRFAEEMRQYFKDEINGLRGRPPRRSFAFRKKQK